MSDSPVVVNYDFGGLHVERQAVLHPKSAGAVTTCCLYEIKTTTASSTSSNKSFSHSLIDTLHSNQEW